MVATNFGTTKLDTWVSGHFHMFHFFLLNSLFDSGYYMCTASNGIGVLKKILYINVNGKLFSYCIIIYLFFDNKQWFFIQIYQQQQQNYGFFSIAILFVNVLFIQKFCKYIAIWNFSFSIRLKFVCMKQNRLDLKAPQETYRHAEMIRFH